MWKIPRIWEGGQCIIIGGGPSITSQFDIPEDLVQKVYSGELSPEVYSPYLSDIQAEHIIAVNMSYKLGSWVDCVFFGDSSFLIKQQNDFFTFKGLKITCAVNMDDYNGNLKVIERDEKKKLGISFLPNKVCWNLNSGAAAINLAVHFGVKRIILLGFDMKLDSNSNQHWHKFYKTKLDSVGALMNRHLKGFPIIANDLRGKVEVINANPNSNIDCFPRMNFKDIKL